MADYDAGEVTSREKKAASNLSSLATFNADTAKNQLKQQLGNYDLADQQNRKLADLQLKQNSRKAASERFGANKKLQSAVKGVLGTMDNALNGSSLYSMLDMINTRTDLDNNEVWNTLTQNQNTVENAYNEALNQNVLARNDAASNAEQAIRGVEADTAAQLNNINPNLFTKPGTGSTDLGSNGLYEKNKSEANSPKMSGYIMPDDANRVAGEKQKPNKMTDTDYFSKLLNQYNQRRF